MTAESRGSPRAPRVCRNASFRPASRAAPCSRWWPEPPRSAGSRRAIGSPIRFSAGTSAANPKFARFRGGHGCELRVQKRLLHHNVASVLSIPKFAQLPRRMLANFGIGTLVLGLQFREPAVHDSKLQPADQLGPERLGGAH